MIAEKETYSHTIVSMLMFSELRLKTEWTILYPIKFGNKTKKINWFQNENVCLPQILRKYLHRTRIQYICTSKATFRLIVLQLICWIIFIFRICELSIVFVFVLCCCYIKRTHIHVHQLNELEKNRSGFNINVIILL